MKKIIPAFFSTIPVVVFLLSEIFPNNTFISKINIKYNLAYTIILITIFILVFYYRIEKNNEILKNLNRNLPNIYKYNDGHTLLNEIYKRLELYKTEISAVYSTAIQAKIAPLDEYDSYCENIFSIFKNLENKPKFSFFYQIPEKINLRKKERVLDYFYNICFASLYEKYSDQYNSNSDDIEFIFNKSNLNFPFINFTLIEYKELNKFEVFYGWYASQSPVDNLGNSFPEVFINTTHIDICNTFLSQWKILVSISEANDNKLVKFNKSKGKNYYINELIKLEK